MTRLRGGRGKRIKARASFGKWGARTFIWPALRQAHRTLGALDRAAFATYVETQLAFPLQPGDIVILGDRRSKEHLRKTAAGSFDALMAALGDICRLIEPEDSQNYLKAAGHASD